MHNMGESSTSAGNSNSSAWSSSEPVDVESVWRKLKPSEEWSELMNDPVQWRYENAITNKDEFSQDRVALKSTQNMKTN